MHQRSHHNCTQASSAHPCTLQTHAHVALSRHRPSNPPIHSWDALVQQRLAIIRTNLDALDAFFERWRHVFAWRRPAAGTVAFPRLTTHEPIETWCAQLVEETGVLLMPSTVYGQPECAAEGWFRLGFGRTNMPEVLAHLEAWLEQRYPAERAAAAGS